MAGAQFPFPRGYRLTKTDEFSSVFGFRKAIRGKFFMLHVGPRSEQSETARLGLVVAKKLVRQAVRRNLLRRIAREQFRLLRAQLPARDLIIRLAGKMNGMPRLEIAMDIVDLLKRVRP